MTDHLTRATAIPRNERAAVFADLAEKCYGKDWRKVLAERLGASVSKIYNMTAKGTISTWTLAYLMAVVDSDKGLKVSRLKAEIARLRSALADLEA